MSKNIDHAYESLETPAEQKSFFKPALVTLVCCVVLTGLAVYTDPSAVFDQASSSVNPNMRDTFEELYLQHGPKPKLSSGLQKPKEGCATLYGSDPNKFPETEAYTVCGGSELLLYNLDDKGFGHHDKGNGISYVQTGKGAYVTLYDHDNFKGIAYEIGPESDIFLEDVKYHGGGHTSWNDVSKSVGIFAPEKSHQGALFITRGHQDAPDHCAVLYGSDPKTFKHTYAVMLCGDPEKHGKTFKFSYNDMLSKGITLKEYFSLGCSYISTGKHVKDFKAFVGHDFDGQYASVGGDDHLKLNKMELPVQPKGHEHMKFGDNVHSFEFKL